MARRRSKSSASELPRATLKRAREQAGLPPEAEEMEPEKEEAVEKAHAARPTRSATPDVSTARARRKRVNQAQLERSKKNGELDQETIAYLLHNPTKTVTEEEMRAQYGHVLADLRKMGLLTLALLVLLVVLAQFI